ncbi:hypothetical protein HXX76_014745 [Chlamydomonas incerta]|uniref:Ubiquitin-like protease family profile domain-containing protein n=1 Tax=Chlamydomonas incerta TaxID=51695 RepID=A0A835VSU0_CHLIN|nr:hypothetical protein HXX76_014745 [Chlamydomonas incerta]|eukprot:KAG2424214.1 hypothetical protein HXX76_014745 [Chlamydomonas incerta]
MRRGERKVLDFGDVLLREADVELLEGPHWLNDQIVSFYFEYMEREVLPAAAAAAAAAAATAAATPAAAAACSVLLLPPATCFLLMHAGPDMAADILAPLKPCSRGLVLLPVNDNPDVDRAAGGSHWSLLVFHRPSNTLRHYDSSAGSGNTAAARRLAAAVGPALARPGAGGAAAGGGGAPGFVGVEDMPHQTNGYDCGVYVLAVARAAAEQWLTLQASAPAGQGTAAGAEGGAEGAEGKEAVGGTEGEGAEGAVQRWREWERGLRAALTPEVVQGLRRQVREVIRAKAGE